MKASRAAPKQVQVLQKTLDILETLKSDGGGIGLADVSRSVKMPIATECRETVNLGTLDGGEVVMVATVESPQTVRMASKVGNRRYLHTTAIGKVLLASMHDESIRRLIHIKGLPRLTSRSITNESALMAELRKIRKQGYGIDNQENEMEGRCIAMQVPDLDGIDLALSISVPVFRMDLRRLRALAPTLRAGCAEFAKALNS